MNGENKKSILKRLNTAIIIAVVCAAAVGVVSVVSFLYIKRAIDEIIVFYGRGHAGLFENAGDLVVMLCIIVAIVVACTAILTFFTLKKVSKRIENPLLSIEKIVKNMADTGSLEISEDMQNNLMNIATSTNDEISSLIFSFSKLVARLTEKTMILEKVSQGDLRTNIEPSSEFDSLGIAVNHVVKNLNSIVRDVVNATDQLSIGASELSISAQSLSESATIQSSTMDELHVTAAEIADEAEENAERAAKASKVTAEISLRAAEGSSKMSAMTNSMKEINKASHAIGSVMKAIDEIAFQTNILALNAAVEAARAGVHGKGFAVVADEVRNLATKSGSAANDSNALIADTISKSDMGNRIVDEAIEFFKMIEDGIANTSELLDEIAEAAQKQSDAIDQINKGVTGMTNIVYNNSSVSEQSAAASQEMSSQATILKEAIKRFQLDESTPAVRSSYANFAQPAPVQLPKPPLPALEVKAPPIPVPSVQPAIETPAPAAAEPLTRIKPEVTVSQEQEEAAPVVYTPVKPPPIAHNPTTEPSTGIGLSPAEIYAEALKRDSAGSANANNNSFSTANKAKPVAKDSTSFRDDDSKY